MAQIDQEVGPRGRIAFLVEVAQAELCKQRMLALLADALKVPIWKDEEHPELPTRSEEWTRGIREDNDGRVREAQAQRDEASA